jgi:hypothetical protein
MRHKRGSRADLSQAEISCYVKEGAEIRPIILILTNY